MHTFGTVISFKILPVNVYTQGDEGMIKNESPYFHLISQFFCFLGIV